MEKMLPVTSIARRLSVSDDVVRDLIECGALAAVNCGARSSVRWRVSESSFDSFLRDRSNRPAEDAPDAPR